MKTGSNRQALSDVAQAFSLWVFRAKPTGDSACVPRRAHIPVSRHRSPSPRGLERPCPQINHSCFQGIRASEGLCENSRHRTARVSKRMPFASRDREGAHSIARLRTTAPYSSAELTGPRRRRSACSPTQLFLLFSEQPQADALRSRDHSSPPPSQGAVSCFFQRRLKVT